MLVSSLVCALVAHLGGASPAPHRYSFAARVVGHGRPMILIPGLACGGDVWNSTVAHYQDRYTCYVLTLPGFAGQPAIPAPILPKVRDEIVQFIADKHLDHPVLIGHSLGGMMALWIAAESPNSVGKVVSVDGLPFLPAATNPTADIASVKLQAEQFRTMLANASAASYKAGNRQTLTYMITASKDVDFVAKTSNLSDPKSVGEAMYELYTTDLRPEMARVKSPVLMLAEGAFFTTSEMRKAAMGNYEAQIHAIPEHTLRMSLTARHFIMLDDPAFYFQEIDGFLAR